MVDTRLSPLYKIANPKSLVLFGASNNPSAMGSIQLESILDLGYRGKVYLVHPTDKVIMGLKAYPSVMDLPEVPDLGIIIVPTGVVAEVMKACGEKGIKHLIVVSAGFREMGEEGALKEKELLEIAKRYGIRFMGPNCIGVANPHSRLNTTFLKYKASPGAIGLASQSGSFVTQMFEYLDKLNMGFSTAFSVGNEADIDIVDCLEYLGSCPHTRVITLYIEGIRRGKEFLDVARSISHKRPIIAYYAGGSRTGMRAGQGHTGAMAGPDQIYDGVFKQAGIIRAKSITELFKMAWAFECLPLPKGNRVVVQTHSGGPGTAAADAVGRAGLDMPELSEGLMRELREYLPHTANLKNPVDMTFSRNLLAYFKEIPEVLLASQDADAVLSYAFLPMERLEAVLMQMGIKDPHQLETEAREAMDSQARFLRELVQRYEKPLVLFNYRGINEPIVASLIKNKLPVYEDPVLAASVLKAMVDYHIWTSRHQWEE